MLFALKGRVEDDRGDPGPAGLRDRPDEGPVVERREDEGVDAGAGQGLDDLDLLVAVVFLERALPDDLDAELPGGGQGPGMDGLPEFVGRADGDDGDPERPAARAVGAAGRAAGQGGQKDQAGGREEKDSEGSVVAGPSIRYLISASSLSRSSGPLDRKYSLVSQSVRALVPVRPYRVLSKAYRETTDMSPPCFQ